MSQFFFRRHKDVRYLVFFAEARQMRDDIYGADIRSKDENTVKEPELDLCSMYGEH
jgi:hypothetical protein